MGSAPSNQAKGPPTKKNPGTTRQHRQSVATTNQERRMTMIPDARSIPVRFSALWDQAEEANNVAIKMTKQNGFSQTKINLPILKPVSISWSEEDAAEGIGLRQIGFDGDKFVAIRNGWTSGPLRPAGHASFRFAIEGEVKLASVGIRSTPLSVNVTKREDCVVTVSDEGFKPPNVFISEGTSVVFKWTGCQISHSVWPIAYCPEHGGFTSLDPSARKKYKISTKEGSFTQLFTATGSYFFSTEGRDFGTTSTCIINVRPYEKEHIIRLFDTHYDPALLEIDQGERVWWQWDTKLCKHVHCPFEVELGLEDKNEAQQLAEDDDENREDDDTAKQQKFVPKNGGFRWYGPSKCGLLCHIFTEPGVYFYSDLNFDQMASYIGTIVVRPSARNLHFVEVTSSGFKTDNLRLQQGDQLWFYWDPSTIKREMVTVMEFERCLTSLAIPGSGPTNAEILFWRSTNTAEEEYSCKIKCHRATSSALKTLVSAATFAVDLPLTGVYHFRLPISGSKALSVICNRAMQIRPVRVMKNTFKPKMLMISKGDVVCWTWRESGQHIIYQVSNTGARLPPSKGGFCSGPKRGLDSAFLHQFDRPGVYYYASEGISEDNVGTIVVLDIPDVVEITPSTQELMLSGLPVIARQNDVVCWSFTTGVIDDLEFRYYGNGAWQTMPDPVNSAESTKDSSLAIKRRCLNRSLANIGLFNYASMAFQKPLAGNPNTPGVVTLIVDPSMPCPAVVYLSAKQGFIPSKITLREGDSLIFDWRRQDGTPSTEPPTEAHNVFLVSNLNTATPMTAVQSESHFMHSGQPVADSTFLTTFTTPGTFTFASQGSPGMACVVTVSHNALILRPPIFNSTDLEKEHLDQGKTVILRPMDENVEIFYSLDGSLPHPASPKTYKYSEARGIFLSEPGVTIVRAIATSADCVWSEVATSRMWVVLANAFGRMPKLPSPEPEEERLDENQIMLEKEAQRWRGLSLKLRGFPSSQPGCGEVIWTIAGLRDDRSNGFIENFQVWINNVTYSAPLPANARGVTVCGLVGGKPYAIHVEAHPIGGKFLPIKSNSIVLNLPMMVSTTGGPLMGVEFSILLSKSGATQAFVALSWPVLEAVRNDMPIEAYFIFIDGRNVASLNVEQSPPTGLTHHRFILREGVLPPKGDVKLVVVAKMPNRKVYSNERKIRMPFRFDVVRPLPSKNMWVDYLSVILESAALMLSAPEVDNSAAAVIVRHGQQITTDDGDDERGSSDRGEMGDEDRDKSDYESDNERRQSLREGVGPDRRKSGASAISFNLPSVKTVTFEEGAYGEQLSPKPIRHRDSLMTPVEHRDEDDRILPSKIPPYEAVSVPDERRASGASKGSSSKKQISPTEMGSTSDGEVVSPKKTRKPKQLSDSKKNSLSSSVPVYRPEADPTQPAVPYYSSPFPVPPAPIMPQHSSSSPKQLRRPSHPGQMAQSDTTSGTTTSTTSSFSSPRDFPKVEVETSAHISSAMLAPPSHVVDQMGPHSPSSVATTLTHRSIATERRYSLGIPDNENAPPSQPPPPPKQQVKQLKSIKEAEVVDMNAPQIAENLPRSMQLVGKRLDSSNEYSYPANNLLETLVDGNEVLSGDDDEHDERETPFVDDLSSEGQEPSTTPGVLVSDLPIPIVQVVDESTSKVGETYPGGQVLVRWQLDSSKLALMEERGLDISAFFLSVTGRVFADRISSHLSFDVAPDGKVETTSASETLLRHQWVLPGPSKNDDNTQITTFSQLIDGLIPGEEYSVDVICEFIPSPAYTGPNIRHREVTSQSGSVHFRCQGPPPSPKISVREVGIGSVTFSWALDQPDFATGYRLLFNGKPSKKHMGRAVSESTIDGLAPGTVTRVAVVALNDYGNSRPSRELRIICADKPLSPEIEEQPNYSSAKSRGILIGWSSGVMMPGSSSPRVNLSVSSYRVYVDGKLDGIVRRSEFATRHGYQYLITNVIPGRKYEITVRAVAGEEPFDNGNENSPLVLSCPVISDASNLLVLSPPSAPQSPRLRVENMTILGIDLAWDPPAQLSLVPVTGFQVLKNGRVYGTALPSESSAIRIREVNLGETVELQLISLTDHPVGSGSIASGRRSDSGVYSNHAIEQVNVDRPVGCKIIVQFTRLIMPPARVWLDKISGRSAVVAWTHASVSKKQPPSHFSVATSYQITWWSIGSATANTLAAQTPPAGSTPAIAVGDVCSQSLKAALDSAEQSFLLDNLKTDTAYTLVVEGRLESSYVEVIEDEIPGLEERHSRTLVLSASADPIRFATGRPPDPPQNLAVLSTTCHSILIGWDPCVEHGVEVVGIRVECSPIEREIISPHHIVLDLLSNATEALIEGLAESTDYRVSVIAVTQEFFDTLPANSRWKSGKSDTLPKNLSELSAETQWLPRSVIECSTSGTLPADEVRIVERGEDWCKVEWTKPPRVVGTNRLVRIIVRWVRCDLMDQQDPALSDDENDDFAVENRRRGAQPANGPRMALWSSNVEVELGEKHAVLQHLIPGTHYQVVVEAVVSVKVTISANRSDQVDYSNRRTVHVPSRPIRFWTRCFLDPMPRLLCTSLSTTSVTISWDRPILTRIVGLSKTQSLSDGGDRPALGPASATTEHSRVVRMHLLGYTLVVNQTECQQLAPEVLSCTLTNCKPAASYTIEIVAQTCIDPVYKMRLGSSQTGNNNTNNKRRQQSSESNNLESLIPRDDIDDNRVRSIHVKLPALVPGCILSASLHIQTSPTYDRVTSNATMSKIVVLWDANTTPTNVVKQFSITYQCERTRQQVSKIFDSATRQYLIANVEPGTVYTVAIDSAGSAYPATVMASKSQRYHNNPVTVCLQIATLGPPEMPRLIVTRRTPSILSLGWTDPRLYSGDQRSLVGFKVVLDEADYTELLPPSCHAFSLPVTVLSPARRVCIAALLASADNASRTWTLLSNAVGLLGTFAWSNTGDGGYVEESMTEDVGRRPLPLPIEEPDEQADVFGGTSGDRIDIRVLRMDDSQIVLGWNLNSSTFGEEAAEGLDNAGVIFQLTYTCSGQPTEKFVTIPAHHNSYTLSPIIPGAIYKFHVMALSGGGGGIGSARSSVAGKQQMAVASSRELTVETPAPPDAPKLRLRAVNFEYVTIEWSKPRSYGNAQITSFKVYVNSVLEITLPTNQLTFTYSRGRGCSEYTFQVQAVAGSTYASSLSEPLTMTWPGVRPPELTRYQASDEATMIRVGWEAPYATTGVTIRELFVHVVDRATRKLVHKVGPIHPDCREAEFVNPFLSGISAPVVSPSGGSVSGFNVFLEVCVAGAGGGQSFWSSPLPLVHSDLPPAPTVSARLLGLDDRMRVELRAARLINRRDSIATKLAEITGGADQSVTPAVSERRRRHHRHHRHGKTPRDYEQHLLGKLSDLDRKLLKILMALDQYSGEAVVSLTVHIPMIITPDSTSPGGGVTGFRIFVDGKQLKTVSTSVTTNPGNPLSPRIPEQQQLHEVRLRLPVRKNTGGSAISERPHRISVACVSRSGSIGPLSSAVEVSTIPFRPFVHFCNFLPKPNACHPPQTLPGSSVAPGDELFAGCRFVDIFRRDVAVRRYFANRSLSSVEVGLALDASVFDLSTRRTLFLRTLARGNRALIVLLFVEASVCAASNRALSMFADFATALGGLQPQLTLIVAHHHHQSAGITAPEQPPLSSARSSRPGHRSKRHSKRAAVQPLMTELELDIVSKPSVGFSLLNSVECDVSVQLGDGRRGELASKKLCEIVRVAGVPTLLILNGETECGWIGRYCALTSTDFGAFINHQINVVSGVACSAKVGGNDSGPGCIHCSRSEKRKPKHTSEEDDDSGSIAGLVRNEPSISSDRLGTETLE